MEFNPEQLNHFKFSSVVLDEFPVALRQVFVYMWDTLVASPPGVPKWDDSVTVLNIFIAKEGGAKKVPMLNKSSEEWDCTALFKATLFAQTFAMPDGTGGVSSLDKLYVKPRALPPGTFHPSVISPTGNSAETSALALDQLRLLRNTLCHQVTTRKIDKATFDHYIVLAKDAFTALGQSTTKIDEIGNLGEEEFPTSRLQKLEDELKKEKNAAIKFKQIDDHLNKIESQVEDVGSDVKDVKTEVKNVNTRLVEIHSNLQDLERKVVDERKPMQEERAKGHPTAPKSCIPDKKTQFVGRRREIENILSHFKDKDTRFINVCGPPAFGKTWLITEIAHQLETPVFYASLRGMITIDDEVSRLLSIFTDRNSAFQINLKPIDWLIDCLKQVQEPFALLLDDADDLLESGDLKIQEQLFVLIKKILQRNDVKLLIASRDWLDCLSDDHTIHLEKVGILDEVASVELVKTLLSDISGSDCNKIVKISGQVPLVMRLMCCTVKQLHFSIDDLLQALEDSPLLEVLDNKRLSNIIGTCFERLTTQDRDTFVSLAAISTGGFDLEEARSVLNLKTIQKTKLKIRSLKRKSLVDCSEDFQHCTIHALFRSFIEEKRQTHQEIEDVFETAQRCFYHDNLTIFQANTEKFLTGRSNEAIAAFQSRREKIISSLHNGAKDDELYDKVVELLSTGELFLHTVLINEETLFKAIYDAALEEARRRKNSFDEQNLLAAKSFEMWGWFSPDRQTSDYSIYSDYICTADCPIKLFCYHGIHQVLCDKPNEGVLLLKICVERLGERCDERVLKSIVLDILSEFQEKGRVTIEGLELLNLPGYKRRTTPIKVENFWSSLIDDNAFKCVSDRLRLLVSKGRDIASEGFGFQMLRGISAFFGRCHADGLGELSFEKCFQEVQEELKKLGPDAFNGLLDPLGVLQINLSHLPDLVSVPNFDVIAEFIDFWSLFLATFGGIFHKWYSPFTKIAVSCFKRSFENSLKSHEAAPGIDFEALAGTYDKFGSLLGELYDYNGAIASYEQANRVRNEHAGNSVETASSLIRIGLLHLEMKNHVDLNAMAEFARLCGTLYLLNGEFEAAKVQFQEIVKFFSKLSLADPDFTAFCHVGLAECYFRSESHKNLDMALQSCRNAVRRYVESLGQHKKTAVSLHLEGLIHKEMNDNQSAIEAFQKASKMRSDIFGDHEDTAISFCCLGECHYYQDEHEAAVKAFHEAVRIRSNMLGNREGVAELVEVYKLTASTYHRLGKAQYRLGDLRGALESLQEASRLRREASVEDQNTDEALELINRICEALSADELDCD
ncbi:hypothetical protein AWC38_SpisGene875 [Stylophora pistillata]|uniref:ATPase AAA-type core domain-containing protein n=1 Tax=Stylophora pistillata TaxID=50429 RepID=A0A2B4SUC3_STYPI|nr:hypothetical protein AWC38_SpisGene875 [Stylophora pistillata]